ncbi:hypothetical protein L6452_39125 [Arctium lappa]|uniref:Uncharacterized protein n=1 Tax=Arctium lappa TaxID=4217 RepID=A0ACB8XRW5_ARCLA|nr:hypothetical protein L6452_39125 [Arctium lappa]
MADSGSRPTFSLSGFLSLQTETGVADDDEDDEDETSIEDEGYFQMLLEKEIDRSHIQSRVDDWIISARSEAIQWIINTRAFFRLRFSTAYLSVTYIDRFLSKGLIDSDKHWVIRLLSVACLSLAAKMENRIAPALSNYPTDVYNFESSVILRMELLVLTALDWRMHSITPFDFIHCFISCFCAEYSKRHFVSQTTQILFATIKDTKIMGHRSSTVAMAATLMAMDQNLTRESLEIKLKTTRLNWLFDHENVYTCYSQMLELKPLEVNVSRPDLAKSFENPTVGAKRKRLAFDECEKSANR